MAKPECRSLGVIVYLTQAQHSSYGRDSLQLLDASGIEERMQQLASALPELADDLPSILRRAPRMLACRPATLATALREIDEMLSVYDESINQSIDQEIGEPLSAYDDARLGTTVASTTDAAPTLRPARPRTCT